MDVLCMQILIHYILHFYNKVNGGNPRQATAGLTDDGTLLLKERSAINHLKLSIHTLGDLLTVSARKKASLQRYKIEEDGDTNIFLCIIMICMYFYLIIVILDIMY